MNFMKITIFGVDADPCTLIYEMNEAYFRFEYNLWSRFDDQGENNEKELSEEQKTLIEKVKILHSNEKPVFRKILFYKNEIRVTFLCHWTEELKEKTNNAIQWSWPQFFLNLNQS